MDGKEITLKFRGTSVTLSDQNDSNRGDFGPEDITEIKLSNGQVVKGDQIKDPENIKNATEVIDSYGSVFSMPFHEPRRNRGEWSNIRSFWLNSQIDFWLKYLESNPKEGDREDFELRRQVLKANKTKELPPAIEEAIIVHQLIGRIHTIYRPTRGLQRFDTLVTQQEIDETIIGPYVKKYPLALIRWLKESGFTPLSEAVLLATAWQDQSLQQLLPKWAKKESMSRFVRRTLDSEGLSGLEKMLSSGKDVLLYAREIIYYCNYLSWGRADLGDEKFDKLANILCVFIRKLDPNVKAHKKYIDRAFSIFTYIIRQLELEQLVGLMSLIGDKKPTSYEDYFGRIQYEIRCYGGLFWNISPKMAAKLAVGVDALLKKHPEMSANARFALYDILARSFKYAGEQAPPIMNEYIEKIKSFNLLSAKWSLALEQYETLTIFFNSLPSTLQTEYGKVIEEFLKKVRAFHKRDLLKLINIARSHEVYLNSKINAKLEEFEQEIETSRKKLSILNDKARNIIQQTFNSLPADKRPKKSFQSYDDHFLIIGDIYPYLSPEDKKTIDEFLTAFFENIIEGENSHAENWVIESLRPAFVSLNPQLKKMFISVWLKKLRQGTALFDRSPLSNLKEILPAMTEEQVDVLGKLLIKVCQGKRGHHYISSPSSDEAAKALQENFSIFNSGVQSDFVAVILDDIPKNPSKSAIIGWRGLSKVTACDILILIYDKLSSSDKSLVEAKLKEWMLANPPVSYELVGFISKYYENLPRDLKDKIVQIADIAIACSGNLDIPAKALETAWQSLVELFPKISDEDRAGISDILIKNMDSANSLVKLTAMLVLSKTFNMHTTVVQKKFHDKIKELLKVDRETAFAVDMISSYYEYLDQAEKSYMDKIWPILLRSTNKLIQLRTFTAVCKLWKGIKVDILEPLKDAYKQVAKSGEGLFEDDLNLLPQAIKEKIQK